MNILIPMAGAGTRFQQAGYINPKPLIDVNGKPMIQIVVENLKINNSKFIFVVQSQHKEKYDLNLLLKTISSNCEVVETDGLTEGAACTTLIAKEFINNDEPLIISNSDEFLEWDINDFIEKCENVDGNIVTFKDIDPKWSFAKVVDGYVTEVAEKNPISDNATAGVYYWSKGSDYVKYAEEMIHKNIRVKNEFYVCPVFNEAIKDSKQIRVFNTKGMWGLGTPEDLNYFLENYK
jgi:hypothetical protein